MKVFVTRKIPEPGLELLRKHHEIEVNPDDRVLTKDEIIRDLNINRTASGSIYNAYFLSYISLTPVMGYLTDRVGGRPVIAFCSLMLGLGALLMGTVHDHSLNKLMSCFGGIVPHNDDLRRLSLRKRSSYLNTWN